MNQKTLIVTGSLALAALCPTAHAQLTQIPTRAQFNAQFPSAALEDFEEARVAAGTSATFDGPLDATTSNAVFFPGEIIPGLRIHVGVSSSMGNFFVSGAGFANYISKAVSYNYPDTQPPKMTVEITGAGAQAVGLDITGNPNGQVVVVTVMSGASLLGQFTIANAVGAGVFFGVHSAGPAITHLRLDSATNYFGLDNVAIASQCYANCDQSTTNPILNVADFSCFLSKFAAGDNYANCDHSTTPPVLNVADFSCFLSKFAAGCN